MIQDADEHFSIMSSSLEPGCNEVKESVKSGFCAYTVLIVSRRYDSCFLKWYTGGKPSITFSTSVILSVRSEYLRGQSKMDKCEGLFKEYQACLTASSSPNSDPRLG